MITLKSVHIGRLRLGVQLLMLFFMLYGGAVLGHYLADKVSGTLPALSCAFDQENADYCVLIPTQHQLHHRVGESIVKMQQFSFQIFLPLVFTLLSFFLMFIVLNKAFCGWICPLGTVQELIYKAGRRLGFDMKRLENGGEKKVRPVKWLVLVLLVFTLPLLAGLGVAPHSAGDAFCQVCPSRIITTLATADTEQLAVKTSSWDTISFGIIRDMLAGFILIAALAVRQPFCRICPMLALHAAFRKLSPTRLTKRQHDRCEKCGICTKACPMDIPEIWKEHGAKAFNEDCTLCGRCVEFCPDDNIIQIKAGPFPIFSSSRDYYRDRIKEEKPDGSIAGRKKKPTQEQTT
jgi:formate hydrogenlyase subunit 6/NADH:ubiquinone oxidoreductase subunit I